MDSVQRVNNNRSTPMMWLLNYPQTNNNLLSVILLCIRILDNRPMRIATVELRSFF